MKLLIFYPLAHTDPKDFSGRGNNCKKCRSSPPRDRRMPVDKYGWGKKNIMRSY